MRHYEKIRESGYTGRVICISTPVVEAGVNFSFGCVIRSKAGLDHVIQAAGRGNRHKEYPGLERFTLYN